MKEPHHRLLPSSEGRERGEGGGVTGLPLVYYIRTEEGGGESHPGKNSVGPGRGVSSRKKSKLSQTPSGLRYFGVQGN